MKESNLQLNKADFETTINGKETTLYKLENNNGMQLAITNYGGRIVSWMAPDKEGDFNDITLGFNSIKGYLNANEEYFGALIGRYANRIDNSEFYLGGERVSLTPNKGQNHLHGGPGGFHNAVWDANQVDDQCLVLQYVSEDGEEGYPGKLKVQVEYVLTDDNELNIGYTATTNKQTVLNLTSHPFFNLGGAANGHINDHTLMINADKYIPIDSMSIPTGEIASVNNTPFDFRSAKKMGSCIGSDDKQIENGQGYDHNFVLNKGDEASLTLAARVQEPQSGRVMEVYTTEPGLQFYSGNFLDGTDLGKKGKPYKYRSAFALETQHFPDSPNQPNFPSTVLKPDEMYHTVSVYKLSVQNK